MMGGKQWRPSYTKVTRITLPLSLELRVNKGRLFFEGYCKGSTRMCPISKKCFTYERANHLQNAFV